MYPVHDVDATLLLALSLAAKRRPAELVEIIAATELLQGAIPQELKLCDAFYRLSEYGLISASDGGYTLTPEAQQLLSGHARKAKSQERLYDIKESLADFHLKGIHPVIQLMTEQITVALETHQATLKNTPKNLLTPKPKAAEESRKPQKPYLPFSARRRKS